MMTDASEGCRVLAADLSEARSSQINSRLPSPALAALADADNEDWSGADQPAVGKALPVDRIKHNSSRATASVATTVRFPREIRRLHVLCRRSRAFQAISMIACGTSGRCCLIHCPTFGVVRQFPAAWHRMLRAVAFPAWVIPRGRMLLPLECSPGASPQEATR